mgnify:CR=1 FL=1
MWFPIPGRRCAALVLATSCLSHSSCGTILHPERIGQPPGRIDPGVVALDGVGLLVFLIPGAIAFAVDFYTGAIYLPPTCAASGSQTPADSTSLVTLHEDPRSLTPQRLEEIVREHTGRDVTLEPGQYTATRINSIDQLDAAAEQLAQRDAHPARAVIFRCQSE